MNWKRYIFRFYVALLEYFHLAKIIKQGQKEGSVVEGNAVYLSDLYWGIVYLNSLKLLYMENHKLVTKDTLNRLLLKDK